MPMIQGRRGACSTVRIVRSRSLPTNKLSRYIYTPPCSLVRRMGVLIIHLRQGAEAQRRHTAVETVPRKKFMRFVEP